MHTQTHTYIILLSVEVLIALVDSALLECLGDDSLFDGHSELIKRVLRLQTLSEPRVHKLLTSLRLNLLLLFVIFGSLLLSRRGGVI